MASMRKAKPAAPAFKIPPTQVVAVEHPMIAKNTDNALKTFGGNKAFGHILETQDSEDCVPLYLRHNDPMCGPILSRTQETGNVLLRLTVPKRTGRKRKRGSQDPYMFPEEIDLEQQRMSTSGPTPSLRSQSRLDTPAELLRTLRDNVDKYKIDPVGEIKYTHRYRGLTDFHQSVSNTNFFQHFQDTILTGSVEKMRQFRINPEKKWTENEELMPPPFMTTLAMPFNWGWHQNPNVHAHYDETTGRTTLINHSKARKIGVEYLSYDVETVPDRFLGGPPLPADPELKSLVNEMLKAMDERPIWTRRSLTNRVAHSPYLNQIKGVFQYVGYQFKGGPWRDAIIKFGVDPRIDPKFRIYQTFFFKMVLDEDEDKDYEPGKIWRDVRVTGVTTKELAKRKQVNTETHLFDGVTAHFDGKIWQACDISDPILTRLINKSPYRAACDESDGFFTNGAYAKIRAIMRTKLFAIRAQKPLKDEDFANALAIPDEVTTRASHKALYIPVPDLRITEEEMEKMQSKGLIQPSSTLTKKESKKEARKARVRARLNKVFRPNPKPEALKKYILRMQLASADPGQKARAAAEYCGTLIPMAEEDQVAAAARIAAAMEISLSDDEDFMEEDDDDEEGEHDEDEDLGDEDADADEAGADEVSGSIPGHYGRVRFAGVPGDDEDE
ncbi:RNA polymerase III transcription factor IIIC subunit-domain-containing protein [Halenospora varia]|nr:RNA polymerase III transcription factor IIIC subunit-domain-containing protein [Halenospora varia]